MAIKQLAAAAVFLALWTGSASAEPARTNANLNLRSGAGVGHPVLVVIPRGTMVDAGPCQGGWCVAAYGDRSGFVSGRYLSWDNPPLPPTAGGPPPPPVAGGPPPPPVGGNPLPPSPPGPPPPPAPGGGSCDEQGARWFLGMPATPGNIEQARRSADARVVRVVKPGEVVTMEFNPARLTIEVDAANTVIRVNCG